MAEENTTDTAQATETAKPDPEQIKAVLDLIRPNIQMDGGDILFRDVNDDGVVSVELIGACNGCPLSQMTLANGVERILKERVPGVTRVVPAAPSTNAQQQPWMPFSM